MKLSSKILIAGLGLIGILGLWQAALSAGEKWLTSMEDAKNKARKEGKDILIDFSGSDWCGWCIKLEEEVFSTQAWADTGAQKYIMLLADFPNQKQLPKKQKEHNDKLKDEFMIQGYPSVFLLDADGAPYAKTGYQQGGPENYLAHLAGFAQRKDEKNELTKQIKDAPAGEKLDLLEQMIDKLNKWDVGFWYTGFKEEIVKLDKDNQKGLQLKYAAELVYYYHGKKNKAKQDLYLDMVRKLSKEKTAQIELDFKIEDIQSKYYNKSDWKGALAELNTLAKAGYQGEPAQKLYYQIAVVYNGLKDPKLILENLRKALEFAPDSAFAPEIRGTIEKLGGK